LELTDEIKNYTSKSQISDGQKEDFSVCPGREPNEFDLEM
jgi:hypothetical protein